MNPDSMNITLEQAETLVLKRKGFYWDGWTLIRRRPHNAGWWRSDGVYDRSTQKWMVASRFHLENDGTYNIPKALGYGL